ncbi:hypothetical protein F5Y16DRAFT_179992 [Xylariaceae sp. FL0255]|nr:hypothetical protein F5Y16DRAFT_179992 [Xylariaceae sp. FL0255]
MSHSEPHTSPTSSGGGNQFLSDCVVAIAGDLDDESWREDQVRKWVIAWGGRFAHPGDEGVTHLLCTQENFEKKVAPVKAALGKRGKNTIIVSRDWLEDSIDKKRALSIKEYLLENKTKKRKAAATNPAKGVTPDETQFHIYRDETYFDYNIELTRDDKVAGNIGQKYVIKFWESHAKPHGYNFTTDFYKKPRAKKLTHTFKPAQTSFESCYRSFNAFFEKKTGINWDDRIDKAGTMGADKFQYQPPTGGKPVGLVRGRPGIIMSSGNNDEGDSGKANPTPGGTTGSALLGTDVIEPLGDSGSNEGKQAAVAVADDDNDDGNGNQEEESSYNGDLDDRPSKRVKVEPDDAHAKETFIASLTSKSIDAEPTAFDSASRAEGNERTGTTKDVQIADVDPNIQDILASIDVDSIVSSIDIEPIMTSVIEQPTIPSKSKPNTTATINWYPESIIGSVADQIFELTDPVSLATTGVTDFTVKAIIKSILAEAIPVVLEAARAPIQASSCPLRIAIVARAVIDLFTPSLIPLIMDCVSRAARHEMSSKGKQVDDNKVSNSDVSNRQITPQPLTKAKSTSPTAVNKEVIRPITPRTSNIVSGVSSRQVTPKPPARVKSASPAIIDKDIIPSTPNMEDTLSQEETYNTHSGGKVALRGPEAGNQPKNETQSSIHPSGFDGANDIEMDQQTLIVKSNRFRAQSHQQRRLQRLRRRARRDGPTGTKESMDKPQNSLISDDDSGDSTTSGSEIETESANKGLSMIPQNQNRAHQPPESPLPTNNNNDAAGTSTSTSTTNSGTKNDTRDTSPPPAAEEDPNPSSSPSSFTPSSSSSEDETEPDPEVRKAAASRALSIYLESNRVSFVPNASAALIDSVRAGMAIREDQRKRKAERDEALEEESRRRPPNHWSLNGEERTQHLFPTDFYDYKKAYRQLDFNK